MKSNPLLIASDRNSSGTLCRRARGVVALASVLLGASLARSAETPAIASPPASQNFRTLNGEPIPLANFHRFVGFEHRKDPKFEEEREALVQERLIRREAKRRNLTVTREHAEQRFLVLDREAKKTDPGGLIAILAREDIDRNEFLLRLEAALLLERIVRDEFDISSDQVPEDKQNIWLQDYRNRTTIQTEGIGDDELLRIDGEPIYLAEYGKLLVDRLTAKSPLRKNLEQQFLEANAVRQFATANGITLDAAALDQAIAERERALKAKPGMSEFDLESVLAETGSSVAQLRASLRFRTRLLLERLMDERSAPGTDLYLFYRSHQASFDHLYGEQPILSTIFLTAGGQGAAKLGLVDRTVEDASRELSNTRVAIEEGATTFEDAARKISALPNASKGGLIGPVSLADKSLGDLARTALDRYRAGDVKVGGLLGPIPGVEGVHLLKLNGIRPGRGFEELQPEIRKHAMNELLRAIMDKAVIEP